MSDPAASECPVAGSGRAAAEGAGAGRTLVVIPAWNAKDDALACLASLRGEIRPGDEVVVVDNGSTDGTGDAVAAAHPWVRLVRNATNLGYAGGVNTGLRAGLGAPPTGAEPFEFVFLLNQDTVVPPGTLAGLRDAAARRPSFEAFQPLLVRRTGDGPGVIDSAGQRLHRVPGASDWLAEAPLSAAPTVESEIFGPCGAASLIRTPLLRRCDFLDEDLFVIFEDVDLAFRMRLAGGRTLLVPSVQVVHGRGISGHGARKKPVRRFFIARNSVTLALRYWPIRWLVLSTPWLVVRALRALSLRSVTGHACGAPWRRAWAGRRTTRAAPERLDSWLTTKSVPVRD